MISRKNFILACAVALSVLSAYLFLNRDEIGSGKKTSVVEQVAGEAAIVSDPSAAYGEGGRGASSGVLAAAKQAAAISGVSQDAFLNAKKEMDRVQAQYEDAMGLLPDKYRDMNDAEALRAMVEKGDKFAATRLGDILLDSGDATGAIKNYRKSAELGAPAALASVAMLLSPDDDEPMRAYQAQKFGRMPESDIKSAYVAAQVAYLRGYSEAFYLVDRLGRQIPKGMRIDYEAAASIEHIRLMELYRQRYGRYPAAPISAMQLQDDKMLLQVNYVPRKTP